MEDLKAPFTETSPIPPQRADPNTPPDEPDELGTIQSELSHTHHPGYALRKGWIWLEYQKFANQLALGQLGDDRARHQAEGRCQQLMELMNRDAYLTERVHALTMSGEEEDRGLEGGNYGLNYEASQ